MFDIGNALAAGIAVAEGRKTWGGHDRGTTIGASEIGTCIRRTWYRKRGTAIDDGYIDNRGAAERGHAIEDWIVLKVQDAIRHDPKFAEWVLMYAGIEQITLVDPPQSATPDGLLVHKQTGHTVYLEIKSQDPRLYDVSIAAKTE